MPQQQEEVQQLFNFYRDARGEKKALYERATSLIQYQVRYENNTKYEASV